MAEEGLSREEMIRQRDEAVQEFFATLTGVAPDTIRVLGEELQEVQIPGRSRISGPSRAAWMSMRWRSATSEAVRQALCRLAGLPADTPIDQAARRYRLLWDLNRWLISRPMSTSQIVAQMKAEVAERKDAADEKLRSEVEAALVIGAALPDGTPGALRLRAHRFIRGGWQFHRCSEPGLRQAVPHGRGAMHGLPPSHGTAVPLPQLRGRLPAAGRRSGGPVAAQRQADLRRRVDGVVPRVRVSVAKTDEVARRGTTHWTTVRDVGQ